MLGGTFSSGGDTVVPSGDILKKLLHATVNDKSAATAVVRNVSILKAMVRVREMRKTIV